MTDPVFSAPDLDRWAVLARKALKDAPLEGLTRRDADGLAVRPLYADDGTPPLVAARPVEAQATPWDLRTLIEEADAAQANAAVLEDLNNGATSVVLSEAAAATSDIARVLEGVALELAPVGLEAGIEGVQAARALAAAAKGSPRARLMLHLDPVSVAARLGRGGLDADLALAAEEAVRQAATYPLARLFLASGRAAHEAGATIGQELGLALASAAAMLRAATAAGLTVERALAGTVLGLSVDAEYLDGVAKVRAARLLWRSFARAAGAETEAVIEARSSRRMLDARDPWSNMLRLSAAGFAGAVGGADAVILDGFTAAAGAPDGFARRMARNTQLVLMEEAQLGRVDDPAAGSWYLDARTRDLAQAGWAEFQRIEAEGGVQQALETETLRSRIVQARDARQAALSDNRAVMVGVTRFVDPDPRSAPVAPRAPSRQATPDFAPLTPVRWSAPFEEAAR
ncbi:MAG TPA: methylmalonyl-CoA mutase family protein [Brevundimonas sp.]|uniref:methylmalonyl-CoA mutase family protein n=1 Tax=Brevundimonas sp. TaxID=1871086 RepID=UPI00260794CD|nr:methylmalonyl-CoA mutase family protein [Brevundimonas sp.]HRO33772.1 methylmalonyl-CoA mutase family protein [Brevundimonas sp.]